jgi:putative SOS response-associated peptidase YedK
MSGQAPRVRRRRTISSPSSEPLALAGLWESNANQETKEMENSATIIVGPANEWMSRHTKKG